MADSADARAITLDLLRAVLGQRRPLDDVLAAHPGLATLESRDRAFARLLVATVLRRLGQIDAAIDARLDRPLAPKHAVVRDILRLGVAQIGFLGLAPHAAVNTAVELVKSRGFEPLRGLVNAMLRRIAEAGRLSEDDSGHLNVPPWLWQSWEKAYGADAAAMVAAAHLKEAPLDITLKNPVDAASWAERLEAEILPTGSLRRAAGGDITALPGFREGAWWVQDAAAMLPARLLGNVDGMWVADLCAAPGGKTSQLAAMGARVTAVDISVRRLARLGENLSRLNLTAETVLADATSWRPAEPFDAVLLDAPCSATGTLRRHPDIAWSKAQQDVDRMSVLQHRLLGAAAEMVRPGGIVVYATCSLQPAECAESVETVLADGAPLERVPVAASEIPGLEQALTPQGDIRTLPCHWSERGGLDGFYVARLRRTG